MSALNQGTNRVGYLYKYHDKGRGRGGLDTTENRRRRKKRKREGAPSPEPTSVTPLPTGAKLGVPLSPSNHQQPPSCLATAGKQPASPSPEQCNNKKLPPFRPSIGQLSPPQDKPLPLRGHPHCRLQSQVKPCRSSSPPSP